MTQTGQQDSVLDLRENAWNDLIAALHQLTRLGVIHWESEMDEVTAKLRFDFVEDEDFDEDVKSVSAESVLALRVSQSSRTDEHGTTPAYYSTGGNVDALYSAVREQVPE